MIYKKLKISKLNNDTINNLLYLFCKQNIIQDINTTFIENLSNYQYDIPTIITYVNDIYGNRRCFANETLFKTNISFVLLCY